jgi:hypothetical protein
MRCNRHIGSSVWSGEGLMNCLILISLLSQTPARYGPEVLSSRVPLERNNGSIYLQVPKIPIRTKRFSNVLTVSSYRLVDTNERLPFDQSISLTQISNQIRPRMEGYFFSGEAPLKVLPFLRHLTRIANQSRLSEATLLWIMEDFLHSPARDALRAQAHQNWREAVHWLLLTSLLNRPLNEP